MNDTRLALLTFALLAATAAGCDDGSTNTTSSGGGGTGGQTTSTAPTGGTGGQTTAPAGGSGGSTSSGGSGGSTTGDTGGTGGTGGGNGGNGGAGGTGGTGGGTTSVTFDGTGILAVHTLLMGDTLPNGMPSSTAWKQYGFDIDGKVSTAQSVDLCKPAAGATKNSVYPDGDNGIDNTFGRNVMPIFTSLAQDFSSQVNEAIDAGQFTLLTQIEGITPGATGTFVSKMYTGGYPANMAPSWNGMDQWPIRKDSLINGDITNPQTQFPMSLVSDVNGLRVWESNGTGDLKLSLSFAGFALDIHIHQARLQMVLSDDNATGVSGQIGGIIDTEEFIGELAKLAGNFDPSLCPPSPTFESIAQQIRQAQDILSDGSQNPAVTCNAISIGVGFSSEAALLGQPYDAPVAPDPCP